MVIQIAIVSGKGGTGKTTLSGALAELFENVVIADCDVDAPNLHLLLKPSVIEEYEYHGGKKAHVTPEKCDGCTICVQHCRFDAISLVNEKAEIDEYACEGCGVCELVCPKDAIALHETLSGMFFVSKTHVGPMVHARLKPGEENSGKLVAEVRKKALDIAEKEKYPVVLIDGAPGIGCPAISTVTGVTYALVVTEPTNSGIHDLMRIVEMLRHLRRDFGVVVNRSTLDLSNTTKIHEYCRSEDVEMIGEIPHDPLVMRATEEGKSVMIYKESAAAEAIKKIHRMLMKKFNLD